jgi:hypothetical protein
MAEALTAQANPFPAVEMGLHAADIGDAFINRNETAMLATAQQAGNVAVRPGHYRKLRRGLAIVACAATAGGAAELLNPASAEGSSDITYGTPVVTTTTHFSQKVAEVVGNPNMNQVTGALAGGSQEQSAKVTFMSYVRANGTPAKYKVKSKGAECKWVKGGWNSGITTQDKQHPKKVSDVSWFYDPRTTKICEVPKKVSPTGWIKVGNKGKDGKLEHDCGNFWKANKPKVKHIIDNAVILFRKNLNLDLIVKAKSTVSAVASCVNPKNALNFAKSAFEASGSASARLSLRELLSRRGGASLVSKASGRAILDAKANSSGYAAAFCGEETPQPPVPVCTDVAPAVICYPKTDGPKGQGTITETHTTPDGSGVGGNGTPNSTPPGDPNNGGVCRTDTGDIVSGTADNMGNC